MELFTVAPEHSRVWIAYPPIPFSHLKYGSEGYRYLFVQQEVWMCIVQCISLHHKQFDVQDVSLHHKQLWTCRSSRMYLLPHQQCGLPGCISFHPPCSMGLQGVSLCTTSSMDDGRARCILTTASPVDVQGVSILHGNRVQ
jgi:hypothetical protein